MANAVKWSAKTDRGAVLAAELNALASGAYSAAGTEVDNSVNRDQWAAVEISLAALTPTAGAYISVYLITAPDGASYEDAPSATNPAFHDLVATVSVATGAGAKRAITAWFRIPPTKFKIVVLNGTGVALAATTNAANLFTANDEIQ